MTLGPMRYKDYVWPHNPRIYEIKFSRDLVESPIPYGLYRLQSMGRRHRVLRGEGEFSGSGAYAEFKKLATVFYSNEPGVLVHPLWDSTSAYFVALELRQEPTENYVKYAFEFWECPPAGRTGLSRVEEASAAKTETDPVYHIVAGDESIWDIAGNYGVSIEELAKKNPGIKNLSDIRGGGGPVTMVIR